jgi:delta1-piperideine-2-carboxylate reductase
MTLHTIVPDVTHVSFEQLAEKIAERLTQAGASAAIARTIARNCAGCEQDGALSHGVFRVAGYLDSLHSGHVDGTATAQIEQVSPSYLRVDAKNGFAQPSLATARPFVDEAISTTGIAIVAMRDSHHFSALWPDIELFAREGHVALTMVASGQPSVMPRGAAKRVFGTNPFAFATPSGTHNPVVMDFATSSMSHGDLQLAANEEQKVPLGTGTGRGGRDTTDPTEIIAEGGLLPFGGHKGAALSLMVEVLASALTGGAFSFEANHDRAEGARTSRTGQLLLVIDPSFKGNEHFAARVGDLIEMLREAGMSRLPGDHRYQHRAETAVSGIPVTPAIVALFDDSINRSLPQR